MDYTDEQLEEFEAVVLRDANKEREALMKETEEQYKSIVADKENEYLKESYETIQRNKSKYEHEADEELLHAEMDAKKKVLLKREEIIDDVMEAAKERLGSFTRSDKYSAWLIKKTGEAVKEAGEGAKTVYVSKDDMRYESELTAAAGPGASVEGVSDRDFIGGVRVYNKDRRVSVDYSFGELLMDEKQEFLQHSGLVIR